MGTNIEIRLVEHGSPDYEETVRLRLRILREPLGLSFTPEQLSSEETDLHLAAFAEGRLVGCLVLTPCDAESVKMRQVAVDTDVQGQGIGGALVVAAEEVAVAQGFRLMTLHARETAVPFYLRLGYTVEGEPFKEVTIPHRRMHKRLVHATL